MILVKFSENGRIYEIPYESDTSFAQAVMSALTGISLEDIINGDDDALSENELALVTDAAECLKSCALWVSAAAEPEPKPKLRLVE